MISLLKTFYNAEFRKHDNVYQVDHFDNSDDVFQT